MVGPQLGSALSSAKHPDVPWYLVYVVCVVLLVFNMTYIKLTLPDTKDTRASEIPVGGTDQNQEGVLTPLNPNRAESKELRSSFFMCYSRRNTINFSEYFEFISRAWKIFRTNSITSVIFVVSFIYSFGDQDIDSTLSLYLQHRFNWNPDYGLPTVFMVMGILLIVWETFGISIITRIISEEYIVPVFLVISSLGHIVVGVSTIEWIFYLGFVVSTVSVISHIILNSMLTKQIPTTDSGLALGLMESIVELGAFIGSLVSDNFFGFLVNNQSISPLLKGSQFYLSASLYIIAGALFLFVYRYSRGSVIIREQKELGRPNELSHLIVI
eukprot:TRINITY_DN824_c3_g1_i8.p1 TRINITY_DN824_c3_g1~~TRINITY_DN824_c3_g1_i8.p1  ORF type:complete len:327 (+),score=9.55 TRINITY_DN824_c3_g1_i8:407-1387(+)